MLCARPPASLSYFELYYVEFATVTENDGVVVAPDGAWRGRGHAAA